MKKKSLFFSLCMLSIMAFCFSACSDDDEEIVVSVSDLKGTWESVHISYYYKEDGKIVEQGEEADTNWRIVFNEDGTCKDGEFYGDKWHWDTGTWSCENNKITTYLKYRDARTVTIKNLTSTKLVVEFIDKYTDDGMACEDYELTEYRKISE